MRHLNAGPACGSPAELADDEAAALCMLGHGLSLHLPESLAVVPGLAERGLVQPLPGGGWDITRAGREACYGTSAPGTVQTGRQT